MAQNKLMKIVLLGKTGSGKSSLANVIYGEEGTFKESNAPNSETKELQTKDKRINGRLIRLIDTPGLFDTDLNNTELSEDILRCIEDCAPGPHAFLLVLKVERYTEHEEDVVKAILRHFSEEALKYTTVVFTHGDQLKEGKKIKDWVNENKALRSLVQKCGGRCHVFDNKYWKNSQDSYRNNQVQVTELLRTIEQSVRAKDWKHYTNVFLEYVKENIKWIRSNLKYTARVLLGALLGVFEEFKNLFESRPSSEGETCRSQHDQEMETLRIVLLGNAGSGKSSLANTIFGDRGAFQVNHSSKASHSFQCIVRRVHERNILLIDTPGFFHPGSYDTDLDKRFYKCLEVSAPGPHAFLLVLKLEKYTKQEDDVVKEILKYFSAEALKYTTVVFTHGDQLEEGQKIEDWVHKNEALRSLVQKCGGRCHVFDNKYWNNQVQVTELLRTIEETVEKNGGRCYNKEMLQKLKAPRRSFFKWILGL